MKSPRLPDQYPDRHLDCQEGLEDGFAALVDDGLAAGWSVADITVALVELADHRMLADAANEETARDIEEALKRIGL